MKYYETKHLQKILRSSLCVGHQTAGHGDCPVGVVCTPVRLHIFVFICTVLSLSLRAVVSWR